MRIPDGCDAVLMAGIPEMNAALYHAIRFSVGDPAALIVTPQGRTLILRDIEVDRGKQHARADGVACPADYTPEAGLSADRETATAQAAAECLHRAGAKRVAVDRSLPYIYAAVAKEAGIDLHYDADLGVSTRRVKDAQEIAWLRQAQADTEDAIAMACATVARATADGTGALHHDGAPLSAERLRSLIDVFLLERGYSNPNAIVAPGPEGADCHNLGSGPMHTATPVIVDVFPKSRTTRYNGDCTRTVVHGEIPDAIAQMHAVVVRAKTAAIAATRAGVTGDAVHAVTISALEAAGFQMGFPERDGQATMPHGTGHGVGLEVHEPPLLAPGGPALLAGDVVTIEPGLYAGGLGGVRVEDMVVVTEAGCDSLNRLPERLDWR